MDKDIDYSDLKMAPGLHLPLLQRLFSIIFKHNLLVYTADLR